MRSQTCFECSKKIEDPLDYNMMPLDNPYVNLFLHKSCFRGIGGYEGMSAYLTRNRNKVYNYLLERNKEGKNR
jgi:hypothetical protein